MSWFLAFAGFAVLIILHEFGHFAAAKKVGMRVERFSLFFPPHIWTRRKGETEYAIGLVPLGGYVRISGMSPHEEHCPRTSSAARTFSAGLEARRRDRRQAGVPLIALLLFFVGALPVRGHGRRHDARGLASSADAAAAGVLRRRRRGRLGRRRQEVARGRFGDQITHAPLRWARDRRAARAEKAGELS